MEVCGGEVCTVCRCEGRYVRWSVWGGAVWEEGVTKCMVGGCVGGVWVDQKEGCGKEVRGWGEWGGEEVSRWSESRRNATTSIEGTRGREIGGKRRVRETCRPGGKFPSLHVNFILQVKATQRQQDQGGWGWAEEGGPDHMIADIPRSRSTDTRWTNGSMEKVAMDGRARCSSKTEYPWQLK